MHYRKNWHTISLVTCTTEWWKHYRKNWHTISLVTCTAEWLNALPKELTHHLISHMYHGMTECTTNRTDNTISLVTFTTEKLNAPPIELTHHLICHMYYGMTGCTTKAVYSLSHWSACPAIPIDQRKARRRSWPACGPAPPRGRGCARDSRPRCSQTEWLPPSRGCWTAWGPARDSACSPAAGATATRPGLLRQEVSRPPPAAVSVTRHMWPQPRKGRDLSVEALVCSDLGGMASWSSVEQAISGLNKMKYT